MPQRFIVKSHVDQGFWVTDRWSNGQILVSFRRSEAKIFGEADLEFWQNKEGFEVVELPESKPLEATALKLPGFE